MTVHARDPHLDLLDDARHAQAVAERSQRRMLVEADDQDATFAASLEAAAETGMVVLLETIVGRTVRGVITTVTADHLEVRDGHGRSWVRRDGITVVRPNAGDSVRATAGSRPDRSSAQLHDELVELAAERTALDIHLEGGAIVRGTAHAAGVDVLTVRNVATGDRSLVHLHRAVVIATSRG